MMILVEWSVAASLQAREEGWDIFDNSDRGTEIERIDSPSPEGGFGYSEPKFGSDAEAVAYVRNRAAEGSIMHQTAISLHDASPRGFR